MYDRRIDGEAVVFGNQGGLFMNAMTWWDHPTESVWSQVLGQAIAGPLKGETLSLIPASIVPWGTWKVEHPHTLVLNTADLGFAGREIPSDQWVIGVALGEDSKAYYYTDLADEGLINDTVGPHPIALYANADTRAVQVFLRKIDERTLTLTLDASGEYLIDADTNRQWDITRGLPKGGKFGETGLLLVPYISAFDWAWLDFHPESEFYPAYKAQSESARPDANLGGQ